MTDLEQAVAEALTPVLAAFGDKHDHEVGDSEAGWFGCNCICSPREVAQWLAPRVAAAIVAAFGDYEGLDARDGALRALRGEQQE